MSRTQWNDAEDRALDYLPHLDQVIYLRGIRRRMDYATGVAGMSPDGPISYSWLAQLAEVRPRACSTMKPPPRPDKNTLRSVFDRLEAAGLIRRVRDHGLKSLVFECLLADRGSSVRNMSHPSATHEPPTTTHPPVFSNDAAFEDISHPSATHQQIDMSHPIQGSGIQEDSGAKAPQCRASAPSRFGEFWDAWPTGQRKRDRHKAEQSWKRHKLDAMADQIITDVKRRAVEDQQWLRGYAPMPTTYLNGRRWEDEFEAPKSLASAQRSTLADRNREAMEEWLSGSATTTTGNVFDGEFCREA